MSYIALYREWRPTRFADVVEQEHVVKTLRYSVSTGRIAHAYLFCGTRGTGKTTMAHILSRAVNCLNPQNGEPCNECEICREILDGSSVDVFEIDAASNNSVDNVRNIRDDVIYTPAKARRKVYIIDEVHMLSTGAFNALLKTLEEPPEHVMFILATTEPHKLPATILSRCQRFDFRRISQDSIVGRLDKIASAGGITLSPDAARLIARMSDGAMRDAISLLDQCISLGNESISYDDVLSVAGIVNDTFMTEFTGDMLRKNIPSILDNVGRLVADGRDIAHFISDLVLYYRNLLICKSTQGRCDNLIEAPTDVLQEMKRRAGGISQDEIIRHVRELSSLEYNMKWAANPRVLLEVTLVKLCGSSSAFDAGLADRLDALEKKLESIISGGRTSEGRTSGGHVSCAVSGASAASATSTGNYINSDKPGDPTVSESELPTGATVSDSSTNIAGITKQAEAGSVNPSVIDDSAAAGTAQSSPSAAAEFQSWPKVMKYLKDMGRMTIYSYLLNVKAIQPDDGTIGLIIKESPIKASISRIEHLKIIEEAAQKITGREMKIKCLDEDIGVKAPSRKKAQENSELLNRARNIADKAGLPLEIIDE